MVTRSKSGFVQLFHLSKAVISILYSFADIHVAVDVTRDVLSSDVMLKHQYECALSFSWTCKMGKTQLLATKIMFFRNVGLYTTRLCVQKFPRSACMSCARGNVVCWSSVYSGGTDIVSVI